MTKVCLPATRLQIEGLHSKLIFRAQAGHRITQSLPVFSLLFQECFKKKVLEYE